MPRSLPAVLALLVALLVGGCAAEQEPPTPTIEGVEWQATRVSGIVPPQGSEPTVRFEDGRISGSTGCNGYGADARIEGGRLVASEITMTLILCAAPVDDLEQRFLAVLRSNPRIVVGGNRLGLQGEAGEIEFRTAP